MNDDNRSTRRSVLRLSGSALATTMLAGCMGGDNGESGTTSTETTSGETTSEETTGEGTTSDESTAEGGTTTTTSGGSSGASQTIRLGAKESGWIGKQPQSIADEKNPTLSLKAGQKYELTWENIDGKEHELIIVDANENELAKSEESEEKGKTVTMTFTATKKMTRYFCEYHPFPMKGQVTVGGE
ncbi:cupredoxin domain-containing protein [Haladaptatus sp. NG-SE-30]